MLNKIVEAKTRMDEIINSIPSADANLDAVRADLMKLTKDKLVDMLMQYQKAATIKVEDVAKMILEDPKCAFLTYSDIAEAIRAKFNSNTSDKSLASYASKYPAEKGWQIVKRASRSEMMAEAMKLVK